MVSIARGRARLSLWLSLVGVVAPIVGWASWGVIIGLEPPSPIDALLFLGAPLGGLLALSSTIAAVVVTLLARRHAQSDDDRRATRSALVVATLAVPATWVLGWLVIGAWVVAEILDGPWYFLAR